MELGLGHYLIAAAILFAIALFGIFANRSNLVLILISIGLMALAIMLNLVAFSYYLNDFSGQIFALVVFVVTSVAFAIGLALVLAFYRKRGGVLTEDASNIKG